MRPSDTSRPIYYNCVDTTTACGGNSLITSPRLTMLEALLVILILTAVVVAERVRRDRVRQHHEQLVALLLTTVGPAIARAAPRELLGWKRVAETVRQLFPKAVATIEAQNGERFPLTSNIIESAHARWTAEWLAWERGHDAEFTHRTSALEAELEANDERQSSVGRARLAVLEDEKLQTYQQRYEEYVRIGNGLIALIGDSDE